MYYYQLDLSSKNGGDLSNFIAYVVQGFKDQLQKILEIIQKNQLEIAWLKYIYDIFHLSECDEQR